jgi:acetamidase/formamidase
MAAARAPMMYRYLEGHYSTPLDHNPEDASETFVIGDLLVMNTSTGEIQLAGANPTTLIGLSLRNATGVEGSDIPYVRIEKGVMFEASVDSAGGLGTGTIAQTDLNKAYGIARDSSKNWYVNLDETSAVRVRIKKFIGAIGELMPRVLVEFLEQGYSNGAL